MAGNRALPVITAANRAFWTGGREGHLLVQRCTVCRRWVHPPVDACVACGGALDPAPVSGDGYVFSFTVNHHPYNATVGVPYVIALVELVEQEGLRLPTNIVGCAPAEVRIGMPVHVSFEAEGEFFVPLFAPSGGTAPGPAGPEWMTVGERRGAPS